MALIEVEGLSKVYEGVRSGSGELVAALDSVSFQVGKGEVVGFLGPNGAGKTTTMRILAGLLSPSLGTARIAGYDILRQGREARRHIGYLPESAPSYGEMTVRDYLNYMAVLRGVPRAKRAERLEAALLIGQLEERVDTLIRKLSKGYRQRVGLAQTVIHDPDVLILDEPSAGLDPRQRVETRRYLRELARDHTVILSTHILPDVQEICDRVLIVHRGRLVAQDTLRNLESGHGEAHLRLLLKRPPADARAQLGRVSGVVRVETSSPGASQEGQGFDLAVQAEQDAREAVARLCVREDWGLLELRSQRASLEEVFLKLTTGDD